jgi:hypothetical protein
LTGASGSTPQPPQRAAASRTRTLARAAFDPSTSSAVGAGGSAGDGGGGAGGGGGDTGGDSDAAYAELLQRVREEQEQLGQLIPHPF